MSKNTSTGYASPYVLYTKSKLWAELNAFVCQREHNYNSVHPKRMVHFEAISQLKKVIDFYRFDSLENQCAVLLRHEQQLRVLIPSAYSRYHNGAQKRVDAMIQFSKQFLNQ